MGGVGGEDPHELIMNIYFDIPLHKTFSITPLGLEIKNKKK